MKKGILAAGAALVLSAALLCAPAAALTTEGRIKVKSVEISSRTATVRVNQTRTLSAYVLPLDADEQTIDWVSSNTEIVTVDGDGILTGISPGTAEVTAQADDNRSATCVVTVPGTVVGSLPLDTDNKSNTEAGVDAGEVLTAAALRVKVEDALGASPGGSVAITYRDKTTVSTAALRAAAYTAEYEGGRVTLKFVTSGTIKDADDVSGFFSSGQPSSDTAQGWLKLNPSLAVSADLDIGLAVYTSASKTQQARASMEKALGGTLAVIQLSQQGSFGMTVEVAAHADLDGLDTGALTFYRYDSGANSYTALPDMAYILDESGYLYFSTDKGGAYIVTNG